MAEDYVGVSDRGLALIARRAAGQASAAAADAASALRIGRHDRAEAALADVDRYHRLAAARLAELQRRAAVVETEMTSAP